MKYRFVNHLLVIFCVISVFNMGCGFQLKRNRIQLLNDASSVSIAGISNSSFTPGLAIALKNALTQELRQKSIAIISPQRSDLVLYFDIQSFRITKSQYSLNTDTNTQNYEFKFTIKGAMTVLDNRYKQSDEILRQSPNKAHTEIINQPNTPRGSKRYQTINDRQVEGSYSLKTSNEDLSQSETSKGKSKTINALKDRITDILSLTF